MKTLTFKTNIADTEGVTAVTPWLNAIEPLDGFAIEMDHPEHRLTVQTLDNRVGEEIIQAIERAGYQAEPTKP